MKRRVMLVLACLWLTACERPADQASLQKEHQDLVAAGFEIERATKKDEATLRSILGLMKTAKSDGRRFDLITRIILYSPEAAQVHFQFHGALNEGVFLVQKRDGRWVITNEYPAI